MNLSPALQKAYTEERLSAREAQQRAEWIAWGPVVFQASRLMVKLGILDLLRNSSNGLTRQEICRAVHAEQNVIVQAAKHGISLEGAELYCTTMPCVTCAKMLHNVGIHAIYVVEGYPDEFTGDIIRASGMRLTYLKDGD